MRTCIDQSPEEVMNNPATPRPSNDSGLIFPYQPKAGDGLRLRLSSEQAEMLNAARQRQGMPPLFRQDDLLDLLVIQPRAAQRVDGVIVIGEGEGYLVYNVPPSSLPEHQPGKWRLLPR
jgi:hypothetical protein